VDEFQEAQLVGGAECFIHFHPREPLNREDLEALQASDLVQSVTGDATLDGRFDIIQVDTSTTSITVTLPPAANGKEFQIVKIAAANRVIIVPTGTDTLVGATQVNIYNQWTSLRFKAVTGGYILL
jgi:hypothetical protein